MSVLEKFMVYFDLDFSDMQTLALWFIVFGMSLIVAEYAFGRSLGVAISTFACSSIAVLIYHFKFKPSPNIGRDGE